MAASGRTTNYDFPFPLSGDVVDVSGDIQLLSLKLDNTLDEIIQDVVGLMISDNTETGISVTYDDPTGKLNFILNTNYLQDTASGILTHNDHIGVTATYNNTNNRLSLEVTGGGGGSGGSSNASLSDMWWLGV
jgi:hypothetical protein